MSEIKPHLLRCGCLLVLISEPSKYFKYFVAPKTSESFSAHPKNKCLSQTTHVRNLLWISEHY